MSRIVGDADEEGPRRGSRARKNVQRFEPSGAKRQRAEEEDGEEEIVDDEDSGSDEGPQPARGKKRNNTGGGGGGGGVKAPTNPKANGASRNKRVKKTANGNGADADAVDKAKTDSPLFNALMSPDIALLPLIEDWVETYQETANDEVSERTSVHELVLFLIRCCGLSADLDEDEAMDTDGVVDVLERIQDETVKTSLAIYPLVAKTKEARTLRTNLNLLIPHLIKTLSLTPLLYQTPETTSHSAPIIPLLLNWLHSMSSSPLRPIRHTSSFLTLKINSALCEVAAGVSSDLSLRQRQKDAEVKKGGQGPTAQKKVKDLTAKVNEARDKKERLEEYMQEIFDVLFVHRVRDADPAVRTDCLRELGVWVKKYGEMYVSTAYLTYFTRGCNDPDTKARSETVKALPSLFGNDSNVSRARTVILRLAPRLIEMALRDVDINVRVHALGVITEIDKTGILQDEEGEQREYVVRLVFDHEPRVRKAVGGFVRGIWQQRVEDLQSQLSGARGNKKKRAAGGDDAEMTKRSGYKALAGLLIETARSLEKPNDDPESSKRAGVVSSAAQAKTRATAAVGALWDSFDELQEWEGLIEYLLLDHSDAEDMWSLDEEEESLLLQVLVACIKQDDTDNEEAKDEKSKTLMNVLPRLFTKHQADSDRMIALLSIPEHMKLSLYLDMRKAAAYDSLWDDVTKQFLQHTDPNLLAAAIKTIVSLSLNTDMSSSNDTKLAELDESVFTSLRDEINGEEVFSMSLNEDRLASLQAILLRISLLARSKDIVDIMDDEEGGQSSGWDIVYAFAERGEVGFKEEAKLVEYAIQIIFLHLTWMFNRFTELDTNDETKMEATKANRDRAKDIFYKLALRERGNAAEVVRRQAFISFLNLHILFSAKSANAQPAARACPLELADEMQHRLGGAFGAAADRFASDKEELAADGDLDDDDASVLERAQQEFVFLQLVSVFVGAIRCGVLEVDHAKEPLAHYGRFGATYDAIVKKLVDVLRDEGIYNKEADTVQHVAGFALQVSFSSYLETEDEEPVNTMSLAKVLASSFVVQGTHFAVLKQIHPSDVCDLHKSSLDYLARRIFGYVKQEHSTKSKTVKERAQEKITQALSFFRILLQLLGPVIGRDALTIRSHLEDVIRGTGVKMGTPKGWEAYKAYEKKLISIAGKDPGVKLQVQARSKQVDDVPTEDEAGEGLGGNDGEEGSDVGDEINGRISPVKSVPSTRRNSAILNDDNGNNDEDAGPMGDMDLNVDLGMEMDLDLDLELDFPTSVSVDAGVKRRKTVKRY